MTEYRTGQASVVFYIIIYQIVSIELQENEAFFKEQSGFLCVIKLKD